MIRKNHILLFITNLLLVLGANNIANAQEISVEKKSIKSDTIVNKEPLGVKNITNEKNISTEKKSIKTDTIRNKKTLVANDTTKKQGISIKKEPVKTTDSIVYKKPYGIRLGIDISKPIINLIYKNSDGLEFVADYRVTKRLYIATEFGFEKVNIDEKVMNFTTKGNFMKFGLNYNGYTNWFDMNNEVYFGARYASSKFETKLNSFIPNYSNKYYPTKIIKSNIVNKNLNLEWLEFQMGTKVETFKNIYIGLHFSYKIVTKSKEVDDTKNLQAPGFNRIYDNDAGFGFNYTISYLIPFYHK